MNDVRLGKLIDADAKRDAVHVPVLPVCAAEKLKPGERISIISEDRQKVRSNPNGPGIVDPFLKIAVYPGQWFWMCMEPGSITTLQHSWTHTAIDGEAE